MTPVLLTREATDFQPAAGDLGSQRVLAVGTGDASDTTVLYVGAAGQLSRYFANCRQLAVYNPPDQVKNDWNDLAIGVCTARPRPGRRCGRT